MFLKRAEVFGIKRIVINRQVTWVREPAVCAEGNQIVWRKIAGGPGFDPVTAAGTRKATKSPDEMGDYIDWLLSRIITIGRWQGQEIVSELYRHWITCETGTLNIVLNDFKKKKSKKKGKKA